MVFPEAEAESAKTSMLPASVPTLEWAPVRLRPWLPTDAGLVLAAGTDPLIPLITSVPTAGTPEAAAAYINRQHQRLEQRTGYSFAIADIDTDQAVGNIGLWTDHIESGRATTGYWVASQFRRQGYLTAALRALTEWALGLSAVERLELYVEPWNEGSWRAAEESGYQREGLLRSWQRVGTSRRDMYVYSVLPSRDA